MSDRYDATIFTTSHVWLDREGWHSETEMDEAIERDEFAPTPRENLAMAINYFRQHVICQAGEPWVGPDQLAGSDHGHTDCWAAGTLVAAVEQMTTWIRENRGRLHRPTCLDGGGCRCGLGDLPMWGAAG